MTQHPEKEPCERTPRNLKHGLSYGKFYRTYHHMIQRCTNKNAPNYHKYGNKGIRAMWKSFESFHKDMYASYQKHVKKYGEKNTTIDRIDSSKGYSKDNCRWATYEVQNNNRLYGTKVTIDKETLSIAKWCEKLNICYGTIRNRIGTYGWKPIDALTIPIKIKHRSKTS